MAHDRLTAEIARSGPIGFDRFMELALYEPGSGFFSTGGGAGRRGDFITSVEVGPLFGAVLANALDRWWSELDQPETFVVVEAGAGAGTLARSVAAAEPRCSAALRYLMVERSEALRERQAEYLELTEPALALAGAGPSFVSLGEMPASAFEGVILANELLDNLPVRLLERTTDGWAEVVVGLGEDGGYREHLVPAVIDPGIDAEVGQRVPAQQVARRWVEDALVLLQRGRLVVLDYADETASMAARDWRSWLRTYRSHGAGRDPLDDVGEQDITCEVALDQLRAVDQPTVERSQRDFLIDHGIDGLVEEGRRIWAERAGVGDLEAVKARSRVTEAAALLDPVGLGGFTTLEWVRR